MPEAPSDGEVRSPWYVHGANTRSVGSLRAREDRLGHKETPYITQIT